ncbi:MAG TPA: sulfite exporter TauE/SafE family protein [Trueperaceae bacterium]|nr:sulfite exporter TauE/SafE family protein [Trueperaceae bacterium]
MPLVAPALIAAFSVACAGVVTGLTGFGFALVSVPLLLLVMDPPSVVAAVLVIGQVTSTVNAITARRHLEAGLLRALLPGAAIGIVLGSFVLRWVDPVVLKLAAGVLVVLFTALLALYRSGPRRRWPGREHLVGGASGVLMTSVGLSGPPVVLLTSAILPDKNRSRATLAAYFALTGPLGLATLLLQRSAPPHAWVAALLLAPVALLGRALGSRLHRHTPTRAFHAITLGVTLAAGLGGVASALAAMMAQR